MKWNLEEDVAGVNGAGTFDHWWYNQGGCRRMCVFISSDKERVEEGV